MTTLLAAIVDVTLILALALVATTALRRRSAALRHAILAAAIITAGIAPVFEMLVPQLPVIRWYAPMTTVSSGLVLTSSDARVESAAVDSTPSAEGGMTGTTIVLAVWMLGAVVTSAGLLVSLVRLSRLTARATPVRAGRWRELTDELSSGSRMRRPVGLLQSDDPSLLVTCGVLRPTIILPAGAATWSDDRRRVVLAHELAHIRRHDGAMQLVGEALRVVHWFNPLVWMSCRRLRQESEYACDDAVLSGGVEATDYATHLLDVAKHVSGRHYAWASAPAIAHPSTLERRIVAMLHRERNRQALTRRAWAVVAVAVLGVALPIAAAGVRAPESRLVASPAVRDTTPRAAGSADVTSAGRRQLPTVPPVIPPQQAAAALAAETVAARQATGTIAGTMLDQSGGLLPGVQVTLTDASVGSERTTTTDDRGRFTYRDLQPARYTLVAGLPGFASVSTVLPLASGATIQRTITMPVGTVEETITVVCSPPAAQGAERLYRWLPTIGTSFFPVLLAQEPVPLAPIRVGGNVRAPRKLTDAHPVCPRTIVPAIDMSVRLVGRIGIDGFMNDVRAVPGDPGTEPPGEFTESALDAVRQWTFIPTLLNGRPVEVDVTVRVLFRRS